MSVLHPQSQHSDLGTDHAWNQYSLQEAFPLEAFDLCNIKETGREQSLISTCGLKLICKYMKEKEDTEWTQPPRHLGLYSNMNFFAR